MSVSTTQNSTMGRVASRRSVVRGAAWTTAAVTMVVATPNIAAASVAFVPPTATIKRNADGSFTAEIVGGTWAVVVNSATLQMYNGANRDNLVSGKFGSVSGAWTGGSQANAKSGLYTPTVNSLGVGQKSTIPPIGLAPQSGATINKVTVTFSWTRTISPGNTETKTTSAQVTF